ncbi:MAG: hypothetical protein ACLQU6_05760, partial [Limisphaerales bacterium]
PLLWDRLYIDPFGLYGDSTMYWANLSINGAWWQQALAWPLGVLSAAVPDAVTVSGNGTAGFIGGGTVGVQEVFFVQQGTSQAYSFFGTTAGPQGDEPGFVTPQISVGVTIGLAWSSLYNPGPSSWTGPFSELNLGEGVAAENAFKSDDWFGVGAGGSVGPVPASASYFDKVYYDFLGGQTNNPVPPNPTTSVQSLSSTHNPTGK